MKKSPIWTVLLPALLGVALLSSVFIYNITAGERIQLENPEQQTEETSSTGDPVIIDGLININAADISMLTEIPGIGTYTAQKIIDYREKYGPFQNVRELLNVSGIGESKLKDLLCYITIGGK